MAAICDAMPAVKPPPLLAPKTTTILPPSFTEHYVDLPDRNVRYYFVEAMIGGSKVARSAGGDEVTVIFVHGFPELWYSWNRQMTAIASLIHPQSHSQNIRLRCIAPDMRGYGRTTFTGAAAANGTKYDSKHFTHKLACGDLDALMAVLNIPKAVFIGHDWGGVVVWQMARRYPSRVSAVASICTPYRPRSSKYVTLDQMAERMPKWYYQCYFVKNAGKMAADELESDVEKAVKCFFRTNEEMKSLNIKWITAERAESAGMFKSVPTATLHKSDIFTNADLKYFVESYQQSGYRSALQWYGAHQQNWVEEAEIPPRIDQPSLMVTVGGDDILLPALSADMEKWCPLLKRAHIEESGHWVQFEQTQQLNSILCQWICSLPISVISGGGGGRAIKSKL